MYFCDVMLTPVFVASCMKEEIPFSPYSPWAIANVYCQEDILALPNRKLVSFNSCFIPESEIGFPRLDPL